MPQEVKKFSVSYGNQICITEFTRATIFPYPDTDKLVQPFPSYFKDEFNIILPSTPGFSKYSPFTQTVPSKFSSPTHGLCPAQFILLNLINQKMFGEESLPLLPETRGFYIKKIPLHNCTTYST